MTLRTGPWLAQRVVAHDLHGALRLLVQVPGLDILERLRVQRQVPIGDHQVAALHLGQLQHLHRRGGSLSGAAAGQNDHLLEVAVGDECLGQRADVGHGQLGLRAHEDPGHVDGHVAHAHHHCPLLALQIELSIPEVRVAVVPGHELTGGVDARQVLAGHAEPAVALGAEGEDDRVISFQEIVHGDVGAQLDVAEQPETIAARPPRRARRP